LLEKVVLVDAENAWTGCAAALGQFPSEGVVKLGVAPAGCD
jgi:hypothetical protein